MPRASYGDKFTVTVMKGEEKHSVFDLTSKISDFLMITDSTGPCTLMILAEEELTAVDLKAETWPSTYRLPYLNPIHASSITCVHFIHQVRSTVKPRFWNTFAADKKFYYINHLNFGI